MKGPGGPDRILSLDVIRGVAIMGILLANLPAFSQPVLWEIGGRPPVVGANAWAEAIRDWLVAGKFRGMLSILFGVGMALQASKRAVWPGSYLRRTLVLAGIGAFHGFFIWYGDILLMYAVTALACMWLAQRSDRLILILAACCLGFCLLLGAGIGLFALFFGPTQSPSFPNGLPISPAMELAAFSAGSPLDRLIWRSATFSAALVTQLGVILPSLAGQFLVGVLLGRRGFFTAPSQHPRLLRWALIGGLGGGLLINSLPIWAKLAGRSPEAANFNELFGGMVLGFGYAALVALLVEKSKGGLWRPIADVGRMALSCYLLTSLICTFIFYGYGLKQFGKLEYIQTLPIAPVVYLILFVFAGLWLRRFPMGPVEHLWRKASEGSPPAASPNPQPPIADSETPPSAPE
jgi:uncharacterized protein